MKKFFTVFLIVLIISSIPLSATSNKDIDYSYKLNSGISINYYIAPNSSYTKAIDTAANQIMYPYKMTNDLVLKKTNNKEKAKIQFSQVNVANGIAGQTTTLAKGVNNKYFPIGPKSKDHKNWDRGTIKLNHYYLKNMDFNKQVHVIIHEMLHIYGLKDVNDINSIMHYSTKGKPKKLTKDANNAINRKY